MKGKGERGVGRRKDLSEVLGDDLDCHSLTSVRPGVLSQTSSSVRT